MTHPAPLAPTQTSDGRQPPAAEIRHATKIYGDGDAAVTALDDVSAGFEPATFTAIMGPSGSGKSTLMHCIAGLDELSSGEVFIGGVELGTLSDRDLTVLRRERVGFVFQSFNLIPTLSAEENIVLPLLLGNRRADPDWFDTVVSTVGMGDRLGHRPSELSGGQQQRVAVARALISRPQVIFADEPTGNLDSRTGAEILDFLGRASAELSQCIVMVTHDPIAAASADAVLYLADGRVVDRQLDPNTDAILERMHRFERGGTQRRAVEV